MHLKVSDLLRLSFLSALLILVSSFQSVRAQADTISTDPAMITAGEQLFKQNCQTCHRIYEPLIGPALASVYDRNDLTWIRAFIRNSQAVIASGDDYAVSLYEEYNQTVMTSFDFSDEEINSILAYIKDQTDNPPVAEVATADGTGAAAVDGVVLPTAYLNLILGGMIFILVLLLVVMIMITNVMRKYLMQKELVPEDQEVVEQGFDFVSLLQNRAVIGLVTFVFTAIVFKVVIDELYQVGVQQGYAPTQPIAFSHKIHAGQYEIDCNYCHTGVMKSKSANIPSVNICMNCHNAIVKGTITGETEIAKILAAYENDQPIEWVRVHNIPDLAYFNHAQHVQVAELECQTCHGPIEEMDVVRQYSLLTMGWCIDCHRTTEVNTKDNGYYDKLVELHEGTDPMTVEDIGGLECARCHY